jgi:hypothetical protein
MTGRSDERREGAQRPSHAIGASPGKPASESACGRDRGGEALRIE